nr:hypothetical protein [Tanacetum cinerariifolium]
MPNAACLSILSFPGPRRFWQKVVPPPTGLEFCPKTGYRVKRTARKCVVPMEFHPSRLKWKLLERISKNDSEEDPQVDSEEEGEPKKKRLKDASKTGSESRPHMLNKENYVPWSSRLLRYAKSRPNEKLIHNSILYGPYVRRMVSEPGDAERDVNVSETFHEQTDDELPKRELKQIE